MQTTCSQSSVADDAEQETAYAVAAEFFSALSWTNSCQVYFGMPTSRKPAPAALKDARPSIFEFPLIAPGGNVGGYSISSLVHVETAHQRLALALFREALASNNDYLRFLFLWQVLSVGKEPIGVTNNLWRNQKEDDDCRNAIGHITRRPGGNTINFDSAEDRARITMSAAAVQCFAQVFVEQNLGLTGRLSLYQVARGSIPEYHPRGSSAGKYVHPAPLRLRIRNLTP